MIRKLPSSFFLLLIVLCRFQLYAQDLSDKSYQTKRVTGAPPKIDGILDDPAWEALEWGGGFTQRLPEEGKAPSQPTEFKITYDDKYLYVAIMAYDSEPEKIVKRMSRRDGFEGDWVEINIDSYDDKRTAFSFNASAAGVKGDEYVSNDGDNWDGNWEPIWYLKTSINDKGWIAEFSIPLSQLRFANKPVHEWGLQFTRRFFRNGERSVWQFVPIDAQGWVHHFGRLGGITGIKPQKQLEIQPYMVAKTEHFEQEEGNPFSTGKSSDVTVGVDGKVGLTSDITLDFTFNPDFGQVEADPSQVNLSAFQVFFREQRPFFIEGNNILNFQVSNSQAGGPFNSDNLIYSRRIGRKPHYSPDLTDDEYANEPTNTRIIGAAKLTGKNKKGFSWGLLESVTAREEAEIDHNGERRQEAVEPLTNYLVGRVQQDINEGNTVIGGMVTATNRSLEDHNLTYLHKSAYSAGIDVTHRWKDRAYYATFNGIASRVNGTEEAILETQTAAERYYQRPDFESKGVDTTRTSLSGTGGMLALGKSSGNIIFQTGATWRSPGLELNDIGFLRTANEINQWTWGQYRILKPFSIFRALRVNANQYLRWDFDGVNTYKAANVNVRLRFQNLWNFNQGVTVEGESISNADLRGGDAITYPGGTNYWFWANTNPTKKLWIGYNQWFWWGNGGFAKNRGYYAEMTYRPINPLTISIAPRMEFNNNEMQYVETMELDEGNRYLVAKIEQETYGLSFRLNYNINPNLSIQYWGQPFIARGAYSNFKNITNASADEYDDRFEQFEEEQISFNEENEEYTFTEDDGTTYNLENPDFNFTEFQSNLVMRWEYKPGSTFFLVWTQGRSDDLPLPGTTSEQGNLYKDVFGVKPHNIFLMKYTYRFVL